MVIIALCLSRMSFVLHFTLTSPVSGTSVQRGQFMENVIFSKTYCWQGWNPRLISSRKFLSLTCFEIHMPIISLDCWWTTLKKEIKKALSFETLDRRASFWSCGGRAWTFSQYRHIKIVLPPHITLIYTHVNTSVNRINTLVSR